MPIIETSPARLLKRMKEIEQSLKDCPESCRKAYRSFELEQTPNVSSSDISEATTALKWLLLARGLKKNPDKIMEYQALMIPLRNDMPGFVEAKNQFFKGGSEDLDELKQEDLDNLIREQQDRLLCLYLNKQMNGRLDSERPFIVEDIYKDAMQAYQREILKIHMKQFTIINLIDFMKNRFSQSTIVVNAIQKLIKSEAKTNDISLTVISDLYNAIMETIYLDKTEPSITQQLHEAINRYIKDKDNEARLEAALRKAFKSSQIEYSAHLRTSQNMSLLGLLLKKNDSKQDDLLKLDDLLELALTQEQTKEDEVASPSNNQATTEDEQLVALRKAIQSYQDKLKEIETAEKESHPNRKQDRLNARKNAVTILSTSVNKVSTITQPLHALAVKLVEAIESNKPSWSERPFIIKIVDILFLGIPALIRSTFFKKQLQEEKTLFEKAAESCPKDVKNEDTICQASSTTPAEEDCDSVVGEEESEGEGEGEGEGEREENGPHPH